MSTFFSLLRKKVNFMLERF
uniref:Uncharacterized protein n=1 Tax=Rhizophora mucronata TaxID=61149 RepID=A0A2P2N563_RHIMU